MKTKGKKPNFVQVAGEVVEGLYYDRALKVYYFYIIEPTTKKKKKVCRRNKAKAALELYNYKLQEAEIEKVKTPYEPNIIKSVGVTPNNYTTIEGHTEKTVIRGKEVTLTEHINALYMPQNVIIQSFVDMLDANPREISEKFIQMGREDLAGIIHLPKNYKRSKTKLSDMLEWYLTYEERGRDTIRYCNLFWEQFCSIVNVPYLEQITLDHIKVYKTHLTNCKKADKRSKRWLKGRYEVIKRIVRHTKLHVKNKDIIHHVLDDMTILSVRKAKGKANPQPISKKEFNLFMNFFTDELKKAKSISAKIRYSKWIALFLTASNTCSYFKDMVDMTISKKPGQLGLDFNNSTLAMYREKKDTIKIAVLWNETIEAIKRFREYQECQTKYAFETRIRVDKNGKKTGGQKNTASRLRDEFWRYIRPKVATHYDNDDLLKIKFEHIRDACFTACARAKLPIEQRNYISGHKNRGDDDNYLLREPKLAEPACNAMYDYFMK
jgi:hypothetical protein